MFQDLPDQLRFRNELIISSRYNGDYKHMRRDLPELGNVDSLDNIKKVLVSNSKKMRRQRGGRGGNIQIWLHSGYMQT